MGEIHRDGAFCVIIYPNDHPPPHVHVVRDGTVVVITLGDDDVPPGVWKVRKMRSPDVVRAFRIVERNRVEFLDRWREIHGA
jgi:hypothetical protein